MQESGSCMSICVSWVRVKRGREFSYSENRCDTSLLTSCRSVLSYFEFAPPPFQRILVGQATSMLKVCIIPGKYSFGIISL